MDEYTTTIRSKSGWLDFDVKELWHYKDLIVLFVRRNFVSQYKQTVLGPLWAIINPLLTTVIFTIIFGNVAGLAADGVPSFVFYFSGTCLWTYFSTCLSSTANTFVNNSGILGKVYFPRLVMPISTVMSNLIMLGIQFAFFAIFLYCVPCDKRDLNYDKYFKDGDTERNMLSEFTSENTKLMTVEEVKDKLLSLQYIRDELYKTE